MKRAKVYENAKTVSFDAPTWEGIDEFLKFQRANDTSKGHTRADAIRDLVKIGLQTFRERRSACPPTEPQK